MIVSWSRARAHSASAAGPSWGTCWSIAMRMDSLPSSCQRGAEGVLAQGRKPAWLSCPRVLGTLGGKRRMVPISTANCIVRAPGGEDLALAFFRSGPACFSRHPESNAHFDHSLSGQLLVGHAESVVDFVMLQRIAAFLEEAVAFAAKASGGLGTTDQISDTFETSAIVRYVRCQVDEHITMLAG